MPTSLSALNRGGSTQIDTQKSFRNADFLKIMLSEVTSQNPLDPQDTSKLVENMQKLQELANTTFAKFRSDIRWAQDLIGETVSVQQFTGTDSEAQKLSERGMKLDRGFATKQGKLDSFRVVDESVFVTVDGHDYPIDNLKQIVPEKGSQTELAELARNLLGAKVDYLDKENKPMHGLVQALAYNEDGDVVLTISDQKDPVPLSRLKRIGMP